MIGFQSRAEALLHDTAATLSEAPQHVHLLPIHVRNFITGVRLIMALPQNLLDDLNTLDTDAAAKKTATEAQATAATALTDATTAKTKADDEVSGAQATQAAALAKVKADLDALYGVPAA